MIIYQLHSSVIMELVEFPLLNEFGLCMASYLPSLFAPFYGSSTV